MFVIDQRGLVRLMEKFGDNESEIKMKKEKKKKMEKKMKEMKKTQIRKIQERRR